MPRGPQGQKRPVDAIGCAIMVGRLATGEITEVLKEPSGKVRSGIAGGKEVSHDCRTILTDFLSYSALATSQEHHDRSSRRLHTE
jgi:hypothetical protein